MPEPQRGGLLDTSAVIDFPPDDGIVPTHLAISAITLAELSAGPLATANPAERSRRQHRLQMVEATFDAIPFDAAAARAYARIHAAVVEQGRSPRRRFADLQIAATALANDLVLVTRNPADVSGLETLLEIVAL